MSKTAVYLSATMEQAIALGLDRAVVIQHIAHWAHYNETNEVEGQFADGVYWAFFSHKSLAAYFPCFSVNQIRRIVETLVADGFLDKKDRYDSMGSRKPSWYRPTQSYRDIGKKIEGYGKSAMGGTGKSAINPICEKTRGYGKNAELNNINIITKEEDLNYKEKEYTSYIPKSDEVIPNFVEVEESHQTDKFVSGFDPSNTNAVAITIIPPSPQPPSKAVAARNRQEYSPEFEDFWAQYPCHGASKKATAKAYGAAVAKGASHRDITIGAGLYAGYARATGVLVAHATTWLNQARWEIDYRKLYKEETNARNRFNRPSVIEQLAELASGPEAHSRGDGGTGDSHHHGNPSDDGYRAPWATD